MPLPRTREELLTIQRHWNAAESATEAAQALGMDPMVLRGIVYRMRKHGWKNLRSFAGNRRRLPGPSVGGK